MCRIACWIDLDGKKELKYKDKKALICNSLGLSDYNGGQGCGMIFIDEKGEVIKAEKSLDTGVNTAIKLYHDEKHVDLFDKSKIVLFHNRWATNGGVEHKNTHPIIKNDCYLIHNGVITNFKEFKDETTKVSETDTEAILDLYLKHSDRNYLELGKKVTKLHGTKNFIIYDATKKILIFHKDNSLDFCFSQKARAYFVLSDAQKMLLDGKHAFCIKNDIETMFGNYTIEKNALQMEKSYFHEVDNKYNYYVYDVLTEKMIYQTTIKEEYKWNPKVYNAGQYYHNGQYYDGYGDWEGFDARDRDDKQKIGSEQKKEASITDLTKKERKALKKFGADDLSNVFHDEKNNHLVIGNYEIDLNDGFYINLKDTIEQGNISQNSRLKDALIKLGYYQEKEDPTINPTSNTIQTNNEKLIENDLILVKKYEREIIILQGELDTLAPKIHNAITQELRVSWEQEKEALETKLETTQELLKEAKNIIAINKIRTRMYDGKKETQSLTSMVQEAKKEVQASIKESEEKKEAKDAKPTDRGVG